MAGRRILGRLREPGRAPVWPETVAKPRCRASLGGPPCPAAGTGTAVCTPAATTLEPPSWRLRPLDTSAGSPGPFGASDALGPRSPSAAAFLSAFLPLLRVPHHVFLDAVAKGRPLEPPRGSWVQVAVSRSYLTSPWQPRLDLAQCRGPAQWSSDRQH